MDDYRRSPYSDMGGGFPGGSGFPISPVAPGGVAPFPSASSGGMSSGRVKYPGMGGNRGNIGSRLWGWVKKNPEIAATLVGTGADIYGAYQSGKAADRQLDMQQQRIDLEREAQERRFSEEDEQKRRNTAVLRRIMEAEEEARSRRPNFGY